MQVVPFEARVVGENFARRKAIRGGAQRVWLAREHDGREADTMATQLAAQFGPIFGRGDEVAAIGREGADFFGHARAERGVAGLEDHDDGFGIFAEQVEEPTLEPLFQTRDLTEKRTAQASAGVSAAAKITGLQRCASIMPPMSGEVKSCMAP